MRVYNGTNSQLNLPLTGSQRITIEPYSVSGDIMPSTDFLSLLVSSYDYNELALIVSGPFEINMCASVSGSVGFVVQSLDEAIEKFAKKSENIKEPTKEEKVEGKEEVVKEENVNKIEKGEDLCCDCTNEEDPKSRKHVILKRNKKSEAEEEK